MRKSHVFVGSSHPELGQLICDRLGVEQGPCNLRKFSNGETSIEIGVSVRDEDVYIVQSGSDTINDHLMELLIFISGCRSGSANKITAVIPSFPYSKQSKMKKHRGAITARMLANLLTMAGADHIITMDLHATQMQGFFTKPVDNLYAAPTLARWIKQHIPDYRTRAVVVSKNPGGTKRVTALADALKINFAMIHTDRRRRQNKGQLHTAPPTPNTLSGLSPTHHAVIESQKKKSSLTVATAAAAAAVTAAANATAAAANATTAAANASANGTATSSSIPSQTSNKSSTKTPSGLSRQISASEVGSDSEDADVEDQVKLEPPLPVEGDSSPSSRHLPNYNYPVDEPFTQITEEDGEEEEEHGMSGHGVHVGRVVQGHIVDEDYPEQDEEDVLSETGTEDCGNMMDSVFSLASHHGEALGGSGNVDVSDDDEDEQLFKQEKLITLVGDVQDKTAIILDDMIDRPGSFVAAAEHCVVNCGARRVIIVATHGIFSANSLDELEKSPCIDQVVVTNTYPIPPEKRAKCKKLTIIDISPILAECIRRNHHGESISALFEQLSFL